MLLQRSLQNGIKLRDAEVDSEGCLPQTGHDCRRIIPKVLTSVGLSMSWCAVISIRAPLGRNGKAISAQPETKAVFQHQSTAARLLKSQQNARGGHWPRRTALEQGSKQAAMHESPLLAQATNTDIAKLDGVIVTGESKVTLSAVHSRVRPVAHELSNF
jgi:hypothetical protein